MEPKHPSASKTVMTDLVLPSDTNPINNLFGGELLARMDRAACIAAERHSETRASRECAYARSQGVSCLWHFYGGVYRRVERGA